jgi:hypothetical protein
MWGCDEGDSESVLIRDRKYMYRGTLYTPKSYRGHDDASRMKRPPKFFWEHTPLDYASLGQYAPWMHSLD